MTPTSVKLETPWTVPRRSPWTWKIKSETPASRVASAPSAEAASEDNWLIPAGYFIALAAGWISHSVADMMTRSGVCWFWPSLARCVLPGNPRYRMEVLGRGELWFMASMVLLGLVLMPLAQRAEGTTGPIRLLCIRHGFRRCESGGVRQPGSPLRHFQPMPQ
jgi:hypothetical protein